MTFTANAESEVWDGTAVQPTAGDGTAANPYLIATAENLAWFRDYVNSGNKTACAKLTGDIVLNDVSNVENWGTTAPTNEWTAISSNNYYAGTFDGDGHTISGIYCKKSDSDNIGFIAKTASAAIIKNLGIVNSYFKGNDNVGSIIGSNGGNISSCYSDATVVGGSYVGGITGCLGGNINNCYFAGNCQSYSAAGGIVGFKNTYTYVQNCYSTGTIKTTKMSCGSIVGYANGKSRITNCYYLAGTAKDGNNTIQNGIGRSKTGETEADVAGSTETITIEKVSNGELCYKLQGSGSNLVWTQYLGHENAPNPFGKFKYDKVILDGTTYKNATPNIANGAYQISMPDDLLWFSQRKADSDLNGMELKNDIDMSGVKWTSIQTLCSFIKGNGYTIKNLNINSGLAEGQRQGLIKTIAISAYCENLTVDNADVFTGEANCGVIANVNIGEIRNCVVKNSTIQLGNYAGLGGISGTNSGTISACRVVDSTLKRRYGGSTNQNIGGITETNSGTLENCFSYNNSFSTGKSKGPIAAVNSSNNIKNCYFYTASNYNINYGNEKDKTTFKNGEVAYLLNTAENTQYKWSQGENYPIIADDSHKAAYKITFTDFGSFSTSFYTNGDGKMIDFAPLTNDYNYDTNSYNADTVFNESQTIEITEKTWADYAETDWYNENETEFTICTAAQFAGIAKLTNQGETFSGKIINLANDVYLNEDLVSYNGIDYVLGNNTKTKWIMGNEFSGTLNGNGYTIYGMYVTDIITYNNPQMGVFEDTIGMFACITSAQFKNLGLCEFYIKPDSTSSTIYAGSFGGYATGNAKTFENCYIDGYVSGSQNRTGSLIGLIQNYNGSFNNVLVNCKKYEGNALFGTVDSCNVQSDKNTYFNDYYTLNYGQNLYAEELKEPSLAYSLNTANGTTENSGMWSHNGTHPILTPYPDEAIYKVTFNGEASYLKEEYTFPNDTTKCYIVSGDERIYNPGETIFLNKDLDINSYSATNPEIISVTWCDYKRFDALIHSPNDITATLIFASYKDGKLIYTDIQNNITITAGCKTYNAATPFNTMSNLFANEIKVFLWENLETMKPLCDAETITMEE